jgi:hypothetical protein
MTTPLRQHGDEALEAQRWEASQAARDAATLDVLNVLYVVKQMLADERYDDAKRAVAEYRASKQASI